MKLAEALVRRADAQKKIAQLRQRLERVVKVQEGEAPAEDPKALIAELEQTLNEQTAWIRKINKTNALTPFNNELSISDALAERDQLMQHRKLFGELLEHASIKQDRFSRSENPSPGRRTVQGLSRIRFSHSRDQLDNGFDRGVAAKVTHPGKGEHNPPTGKLDLD